MPIIINFQVQGYIALLCYASLLIGLCGARADTKDTTLLTMVATS